jgi:arylsulfatase A-like enzyme
MWSRTGLTVRDLANAKIRPRSTTMILNSAVPLAHARNYERERVDSRLPAEIRVMRFLRSSLVLVAAIALAVISSAIAAPARKTNVLLLIADDLNCELGVYGAPGMQTPNIDRLAARGVRFERAYCQYPSCAPSRASFLTGRRPNITGVLLNPGGPNPYTAHFRTHIPDTITLPQLFKDNGWFSARVGKLFHYGVPMDIGTSSLDDFASWDLVINPRGRDRDNQEPIHTLKAGQYAGTISWLCDDEGRDEEHTDGIGATEAIRLLERFKREARPFFLGVGFYRPHTPFVAPKKYFDLYPLEHIAVPVLNANDRARAPAAAYASAQAEQDTATDLQRRQAIQAYRASTSFMDAQVGRVIDALDRLGLAGRTVVIFTSDHGYHLGDHGLWQKGSLFERSVRVPLIIAAPGTNASGQVARGMAELVDLYPTLADLCGLRAPGYLDGMSLRPVLDDPTRAVKTAAFSQVMRRAGGREGFTVRSGRWRYTEWDAEQGVVPQLFDEDGDPAETDNLASAAEHAGVVAELHGLIARERARR